MCIQGCRTFRWGGTGTPAYDDEGRCVCVCQERWLDRNILDRASCVPLWAHLFFCLVGLVLSIATLFHVAYHLHRQLKFHRQQISAATSPREKCRRTLHVATFTAASIIMFYFFMVLANVLRWSVVVLVLAQIPFGIGGVMIVRMWVYTNDPRLTLLCPEILTVSRWLESWRGHCSVCVVVSIAPSVAVVFAALAASETAMRIVSIGILLLVLGTMSIFWVCGKSLLRAIDDSLKKKTKEPEGGSAPLGDPFLLAARKKIRLVMFFTGLVSVAMTAKMSTAVFTVYGMAMPMPLIGMAQGHLALIWHGVNVQLHAGRTVLHTGGGDGAAHGVLSGMSSPIASAKHLLSFGSQRVIPTQGNCLHKVVGGGL